MHVIATAGHVDHGKSTLVRALTGMEPDRWAEERRRGMTIDLGYAWTELPTGGTLAFVDVPGHQRFIGNMLAGLGPAPAVMFVVAADEGWRQQSAEHLAAIDALRLRHGLLVVTRSDLADPGPAIREATEHLSTTSLGPLSAVAVSGATGAGIDALRTALSQLVAGLPAAEPDRRVRLWVDRAFTIRGSGTVATGTLGEGRLTVDQTLELNGLPVQVRGLQSLGQQCERVAAVARVAVNLRGVPRESITRGDVLLTPQAWRHSAAVDVQLTLPAAKVPAELTLHIGTAAVPVRVRPLASDAARLTLARPLPLQPGDRAILRDPGRKAVVGGVLVVDIDPPVLRRRGAAARRGQELHDADGLDPVAEITRRGAVRRAELTSLGVSIENADGVREVGEWLVADQTWDRWAVELSAAVDLQASSTPLNPGLPLEVARQRLRIPDIGMMAAVAQSAGLTTTNGRVHKPDTIASLGSREADLVKMEKRLQDNPFDAPEQGELDAAGLGPKELAAAAQLGRLIRLRGDVVILPVAPALAMRILAALPQPFTASAARQALGTTRRVAIPLLEYLDDRRWTRRIDDRHREVVRSSPNVSIS